MATEPKKPGTGDMGYYSANGRAAGRAEKATGDKKKVSPTKTKCSTSDGYMKK